MKVKSKIEPEKKPFGAKMNMKKEMIITASSINS